MLGLHAVHVPIAVRCQWLSSRANAPLVGTSKHEVHLFELPAAHVPVAHCRACGHPARPPCRRSASQGTRCMSACGC